MEDIETHISKSKKYLEIAEYVFLKTYKTVNDPKLFLTIMHNIDLSVDESKKALILFAKKKRKNLKTFEEIGKEYKIQKELIDFATSIKKIIEEQKQAPVEFRRKKMFIICSDSYKISRLDEKIIRDSIFKAKIFIDKTQQTVNKS